ncbi:MAG: hypothetical protein ACLTYN_15440 [Dysosmobacter welbionis]
MVLYGLLYVEGWLCLIAPPIIWKTSGSISRTSWKSSPGRDPGEGVGVWKMFIDDIESRTSAGHALPERLSNLAVPVVVFAAMFLTDWKLGLLSLCSLPLGVLAMGMMYRSGMSKMETTTPPGRK